MRQEGFRSRRARRAWRRTHGIFDWPWQQDFFWYTGERDPSEDDDEEDEEEVVEKDEDDEEAYAKAAEEEEEEEEEGDGGDFRFLPTSCLAAICRVRRHPPYAAPAVPVHRTQSPPWHSPQGEDMHAHEGRAKLACAHARDPYAL